MSRQTQSFALTGSTSIEVKDVGLQAIEGEAPITLIGIIISVDKYNGAIVKAYEGQTQKQAIPDRCIRSYAAIASHTPTSDDPLSFIPVDKVLKPGNPYKIAIGNATTATSITGAYVFDQADA